MKKKLIVLVIVTLFVGIISGLVVLQNHIKSENNKTEPTFLETMNGDGIMFMPTGVLFEQAWNYSDDIEKVFKVSPDMKMETFERSVITKNIIRKSYGVLEEIDISRYKDFLKFYDNSENSSLEFSEKVFLKNNKKAWGVAFYKQSETTTAGFSKRYILFEQNDGMFYIGVAVSSSGSLKETMHCYVLFETEIVVEDEITDLYSEESRVMYSCIFDFESDGKKEELIIFDGGYDVNDECSTLIFSANLKKGFCALKVENECITRYYDNWIYDECYFLEENGELFLCYKYPEGVTKCKISLDKKNNKIIVESHEECINFTRKESDIATTAAQ